MPGMSPIGEEQEAVYVLDAGLRFTYVNEEACRSLGYGREELIGLMPSDIAPCLTPEDATRIWEKILTGGYIFETRHRRRDGSEFPVEIRGLMFEHLGVPIQMALVRDITERKRMEDALIARESESRRQLQFQQSLLSGLRDTGVILIVVEGGKCVYTNDHHWGCHLGYAQGELAGPLCFTDMIHPDDRPRISEMHRNRLAGKPVPSTYEIGALAGDGSRREYEFHVTVVPDSDPPQSLTLALDISGRKRAEMELQRREREFRTLVENTPDVIVRYDCECRRTYVNPAWERVNGIPARDVIGKSPQELSGRVKPVSADFERMLRRVMETGNSESMELNWRDEAGGQVYFELNAIPEFDSKGNAVSVLAVARDISGIKDSQSLMAQFVASFPGFAYSFRMSPDGHGSFPFASPGIEKIYGLKPADVKGDMAPLHALAHPDDAPRIEVALAESARTMAPVHVEYRVCRPGLPERWTEFRSSPVPAADGSIVWHGIMLDISERKQAEQALEESRIQLRGLITQCECAREEERRLIARDVHDELGQILTGLKMQIAVIALLFAADSEPLREHVKEAMTLMENAIGAVRQISTALRPVAMDMGVVAALEWQAGRFKTFTSIPCKLHFSEIGAELDENIAIAIFRIVQESLTNITRHAGASNVEISLQRETDSYVLKVCDDGNGFDMGLKKSNSFGLVGIRERALMLGGELLIISSPERGTEIVVRIPVEKIARRHDD